VPDNFLSRFRQLFAATGASTAKPKSQQAASW